MKDVLAVAGALPFKSGEVLGANERFGRASLFGEAIDIEAALVDDVFYMDAPVLPHSEPMDVFARVGGKTLEFAAFRTGAFEPRRAGPISGPDGRVFAAGEEKIGRMIP